MELTQELIAFVAKEVNGTTVLPSGEKDENGNPIPRLDPQGNPIDFAKWERLTMVEAIIKHWPSYFAEKPSIKDFSSAENLAAKMPRPTETPKDSIADPQKRLNDLAILILIKTDLERGLHEFGHSIYQL